MTKKTFSLEIQDNNKVIRSIQIIFGIVLIIIAGYWLIYNIRSTDGKGSLWITLIFLTGFGAYQIYSGLGFARKYIEFGDDILKIRTNSFVPSVSVKADAISTAEVYPLKVVIVLKTGKKILIRLGVTDTLKIENIKDEIIRFVTRNNVQVELRNE